ncbi:nucleotidyltransferase family protein [Rhodopila sp.]|uniref:nucleotidyltransferase family protein n=1 Tax=Rhodopila sp. TaxID=2480087 RepID=UPI003D0FD1F8
MSGTSCAPAGPRAWILGSRATGTVRRYSDLDVALEGNNPLGHAVLGQITEALSVSDLPFKVDVLDLRVTEAGFQAVIEPDMITLPF